MDTVIAALLVVVLALYLITVKEKYRGGDYWVLVRGGVAGFGMVVFSFLVQSLLDQLMVPSNLWNAFIYASGVEEGLKLLLLNLLVFRGEGLRTPYDYIKVSLVASFVFAGIENLLYVKIYYAPEGLDVAALRMYTAIPMHALCGTSLGYLMWKRRSHNAGYALIRAFLVPWMIHGVYDFCAFEEELLVMNGVLVFACFLNLGAIRSYLR